MENRNRNLALLIGSAVLYIVLGNMIGFFTVTALIVFWLAIMKIRAGDNKLGYLLLGAGLIMLIHDHFILVILLAVVCIAFFYYKSKAQPGEANFLHKHNVLHSLKKGHEQYVLSNMSVWSVINEVNLDLSYALLENDETTIVLQGVIGDIDLVVPEEMAISIDVNVVVGEVDIGRDKESGVMCRVVWRSPDYEESEHKLKLICSFAVGDISINIL